MLISQRPPFYAFVQTKNAVYNRGNCLDLGDSLFISYIAPKGKMKVDTVSKRDILIIRPYAD